MFKKLLGLFVVCFLIWPSLSFAASSATCYDLADTSAMLHTEGADASTTFTDEDGKTWTAAADAQIDTAQFKFGTASGLFDGAGDAITTPDHADFAFGANPFTIDCWVRLNAVSIDKSFASQSNSTLGTQDTSDMFTLQLDSVDSAKIQIRVISGGVALINQSALHGMSTGIWYHVALIRGWGGVTNDWAVTVNGSSVLTFSDTDAWPDFTNVFAVGWAPFAGNIYYNGWVDEWRVTKGLAIWTANFTAPSSAYTECTVRNRIIMVS